MHSPLIVHSHLRWDFVWQRPQQILSRLAPAHRVLFLEEPQVDPGGTTALELSEPQAGIVRATPKLPATLPIDAQHAAVLSLVRRALASDARLHDAFDAPIQWFYTPMPAPTFLGAFGEVGVVYDCMDELANFRFAPSDLHSREAQLLANADIVFTGGFQLYEAKARHHANVHFFGCGVDVEHFGRARVTSTEAARELRDLPHPRFGYYGVIDERLDYALIARLAEAHPESAIVMVGPVVKVDPADLPRAPNIHWLGQRSYDELPALVKGFDVCLMPFALNEATRFINPTKTLEYMAAGKPIVSTAVPDVVRNFTPIVDVAHSHDEFVAAAERAARTPRTDAIAQGIARAKAATWTANVAAMRARMLEAMRRRAATALAA